MTERHREMIGGIVERFVVDSVRKYDGPLAAKFLEISVSAQFIERLEDYVRDTSVLSAAISKMSEQKIRTIRDILLFSPARLMVKCGLSEDEANIVIACLFGVLRAQRARIEYEVAANARATESRCVRCDRFRRVTVYTVDGSDYTEREARAAFPGVSLFELAGRADVEVTRQLCGCPRQVPAT